MQPYVISLQIVAGLSAIDERAAVAGAESRIYEALHRAGLGSFSIVVAKAEPRPTPV